MNNRQFYCNNMRQQNSIPKPSSTKQVIVEVRCVFMKVSQVDTVNEHYCGDVFIHAKWREPQLDNRIDAKGIDLTTFWNPKLYIENIYGEAKETVSLDVIYPDKKRLAYIVEKRRVKGVFHETLELKQFPFDCQDLSVNVSTECSIDELDLVESVDEISKLINSDSADSQEWNLHSHVETSTKEVSTDCDIGSGKRQVIVFTCRASRRFGYFLVNHVLISALLCLLTFCSFAVNPKNTHGRLQLCMIILLTTVTFKVVVSQNLPKISYLTYLDKAVLGNIFTIMCLCIWHAVIAVFFHDTEINHEEMKMVTKIRTIERIVIPSLFGIYLLTIAIFGLVIYFDAGSRRRLMQAKDDEFMKKARTSSSKKICCGPF